VRAGSAHNHAVVPRSPSRCGGRLRDLAAARRIAGVGPGAHFPERHVISLAPIRLAPVQKVVPVNADHDATVEVGTLAHLREQRDGSIWAVAELREDQVLVLRSHGSAFEADLLAEAKAAVRSRRFGDQTLVVAKPEPVVERLAGGGMLVMASWSPPPPAAAAG
jgi:hypothetical protein